MRASILIALLLTSASAREPDSTHSLSSVILADAGKTLRGMARFATSPLRFDRGDWLAAGGVLAGTALVMTQDRSIHDLLHAEGRESYNGDFWDVPTVVGDFAGAGGIAVVFYGVGLASGSEHLRVTGRLIVESIASAGLAALALRILSGRNRPFTGSDPWHFRPIGWIRDRQSFPSGHTTTAFALCTVLGERIGTTWARIGLYGLATLTAAARVRNNQHWPSDVAMGAALGISAGLQALQHEQGRDEQNGLRIVPSPEGLTLVYLLP
jgi:membrane-associated phospholipid phosphatase